MNIVQISSCATEETVYLFAIDSAGEVWQRIWAVEGGTKAYWTQLVGEFVTSESRKPKG